LFLLRRCDAVEKWYHMYGLIIAKVAILLFTDMQLIGGCFELLQKHLSAKKSKKDLNDAKEAELCAIV
jgi:hypothetical protein